MNSRILLGSIRILFFLGKFCVSLPNQKKLLHYRPCLILPLEILEYIGNIYPCEIIMKVKTTKFSTDPKMHCIWSQFAACEIWGWTKLMIRGQLDIQLGRVDRQINPLKIKCPQFQSFSSEKAIADRVLSCRIFFSLCKMIHKKR